MERSRGTGLPTKLAVRAPDLMSASNQRKSLKRLATNLMHNSSSKADIMRLLSAIGEIYATERWLLSMLSTNWISVLLSASMLGNLR